MPKSMVVYIPDLRVLLQNKETWIHEKMRGDWPDRIHGAAGYRSLRLENVSFSSTFFHYIEIDCNTNRMTFLRHGDGRFRIGEAVLGALQELEIDDFTPCSLSCWVYAPGWRTTQGLQG